MSIDWIKFNWINTRKCFIRRQWWKRLDGQTSFLVTLLSVGGWVAPVGGPLLLFLPASARGPSSRGKNARVIFHQGATRGAKLFTVQAFSSTTGPKLFTRSPPRRFSSRATRGAKLFTVQAFSSAAGPKLFTPTPSPPRRFSPRGHSRCQAFFYRWAVPSDLPSKLFIDGRFQAFYPSTPSPERRCVFG